MLATVITILAAVLFVGLLVTLLLISIHNRLVRLRTRCETAFAQLQVHMSQRYALIAPLIEAATGSPHLSAQTLHAVAVACHSASDAEQSVTRHPGDRHVMRQLIGAEAVFDEALGQWKSIVTAHATLPDDVQVIALQKELDSTNSRISFARAAYDDFAAHYHAGCQQFPASWVAKQLGFGGTERFQDARHSPLQDDQKP